MKTSQFRLLIRAKDYDATIAFWEGALGLERVGGWDRDDSSGAVLGTGGTAFVVIYGAGDTAYDFPPPQNVDAEYERLIAAGIDIADPPEDQEWGLRTIRLVDPNGVPLYLFSETG